MPYQNKHQVITTRIWRMGEGNVFSLFTFGGGQVSPAGGGVRSVQLGGGVRSVQLVGGESGQSSRGGSVQPVGGGSGQYSQGGSVSGGVSPARGGQHLAPSCGWYASCVHTGGLSCYWCGSYSRGQTIRLEIHIGLGTISLETFCPPERLPDPRTE